MTATWQRVTTLLNPPAPGGGTAPIRDAIFSLERLEQHAAELAAEHRLTSDPRGRPKRIAPRSVKNLALCPLVMGWPWAIALNELLTSACINRILFK